MSSESHQITRRYVSALFDLAKEAGLEDTVKKDMQSLKSILAQSKELQQLIVNPVISRASAEKAINAVLTAAKTHDLTRKFFMLLARQRRLSLTSMVIENYMETLAASRGELTAKITSAQPLSPEEIALLSSALTKSSGKKVEIKTEQNALLIGGVQLRIGSMLLDNSIAGKLSRLRMALTKAA